ncbi:MAG: lipopolysaccharide biosynthesis protein [Planctomycetes bacterium]|nr:lipopolysaccharide biosynthesis protein [Planctomycetota bacterium]
MSDVLLQEPTSGEVGVAEAPVNIDRAPADRLAVGMAFLLAMTVVQRGIGLVRNILFCRMMTPEELGRWNLAFAFLVLAAPLAGLGLPGSFGRYAEHFRQRGYLRTFLHRTTLATAMLALSASMCMLLLPEQFSRFIFRDAQQAPLTLMAAIVLAAVIAFNAMTELSTALRRTRITSLMNFVNSLAFAAIALALLATTEFRVGAVLTAYGAACVAACLGGVFFLRDAWRGAPNALAPLRHAEFWSKLAPFAAWVWLTNLLTNLGGVVDRYMILYFADADAGAAAALVGQYHSSRVAPEMLAGVAMMLAAAMLPYLSRDWEAGDRRTPAVRVNLALKLIGLSFTAAGAALLAVGPLLFGWALEGKYSAGEAVFPWTLVLCIWLSLAVIAQSYLWCAERAGLATSALAVGLIANAALNALLLPPWGMPGAVIATAASNGVMWLITLAMNRRVGMKIDGGAVLAGLAPLSLVLGLAPAAAIVGVLTLLAFSSQSMFTAEEKKMMFASLQGIAGRSR